MKNLIKFILFLMYTIGVFFVEDYISFGLIVLFNIGLMIVAKISLKKAFKNTIKILPFILFTIAINTIFADFKFSILIGIRLILIRNLTYIFSKTISYMEFAEVTKKIVYPLKIFGINPEEIGLIVIIALSFIPIIKNEFDQIRNVLKVKGIRPNTFNLLKNLGLIFKPFLISVMQRINEIEMSLKAKGYQE